MRIAVASCWAYRDTWVPFFSLFHKFWRDCPYSIYLITDHFESVPLPYDVRVFTTSTDDWCKSVAEFAALSDGPILLFLDDFFLTSEVHPLLIERGLKQLESKGAGCVRLYPCPGSDDEYGDEHFGIVRKGAPYRISTMAAIWAPAFLRKIAERCHSPWDFELSGSLLSNELPDPVLAFRREVQPWPMEYLCSGVTRGLWNPDTKVLCDSEGIAVDWSRRGFAA